MELAARPIIHGIEPETGHVKILTDGRFTLSSAVLH